MRHGPDDAGGSQYGNSAQNTEACIHGFFGQTPSFWHEDLNRYFVIDKPDVQYIFNGLIDHFPGSEIDGGLPRRNFKPRQCHLSDAFPPGDYNAWMSFTACFLLHCKIIGTTITCDNCADFRTMGDIRIVASIFDDRCDGLAAGYQSAAMNRNPDAVSGQQPDIDDIGRTAGDKQDRCSFGRCRCRGSGGESRFEVRGWFFQLYVSNPR